MKRLHLIKPTPVHCVLTNIVHNLITTGGRGSSVSHTHTHRFRLCISTLHCTELHWTHWRICVLHCKLCFILLSQVYQVLFYENKVLNKNNLQAPGVCVCVCVCVQEDFYDWFNNNEQKKSLNSPEESSFSSCSWNPSRRPEETDRDSKTPLDPLQVCVCVNSGLCVVNSSSHTHTHTHQQNHVYWHKGEIDKSFTILEIVIN